MPRYSILFLSSILTLFFLFIQIQYPGNALSGGGKIKAEAASDTISDQSSAHPVLGQIQTRDKVVIIRSGTEGRLYTVKSKDGNILAVDLDIGELDARFPELKEVVENGLAGDDATLRIKDTFDNKILIRYGIGK